MERLVLTQDEAQLRARRTSMKWRAHEPDVLPLWVAEMDAEPAPPVVAELRRIAEDGDLGYPVGPDYLQAVTGWARRSFGVDVPTSRARLAVDVMSGVRESLRLVTGPGDPVVITTPVYPPFHAAVRGTGRRLVTCPLGGTGRLDLAALEATFAGLDRGQDGRAALLLANPHNPTGVAHTPEELRAVLTLAREHRVSVVSDEIHAPLVLPGARFTSVLSLDEGAEALVSISPAKGYNLAGLKAGAVLAGPDAAHLLAGMPDEVDYTVGHVAMRVHAAAMRDGDAWLADLVSDLDANRALLGELLAEHLPQVRWRPMEATYLAWLDVSELGLDAARILQQARVALNDGPTFGPGGEGFVRMNLATSPQIITEAVTRIARAL